MENQSDPFPVLNFSVLGVGASAGGITALRSLIGTVPSRPAFALAIVQHLHPDHVSRLAEILSRLTPLPIIEVMGETPAWANIKPMKGRVKTLAFSPFLYRYRNLVERFFSKIKHFRAVATRFEKHDVNYLAVVKLAAARIWMRFMSR